MPKSTYLEIPFEYDGKKVIFFVPKDFITESKALLIKAENVFGVNLKVILNDLEGKI